MTDETTQVRDGIAARAKALENELQAIDGVVEEFVEVMRTLGHPRFRLAGHDRGARVSHRLCVDHPDAVEQVALIDISPTRKMYMSTNFEFATLYYHWFFLIQPFDLPERMIGSDPVWYLRRKTGSFGTSVAHFDARALAEYERCFRNPEAIHAMCEDYRASASIDLEHDRADLHQRVRCPLLALWGDKGVVHRLFDPIADWGSVADNVRGKALPCGHYVPEEAPEETLAAFRGFFADNAPNNVRP